MKSFNMSHVFRHVPHINFLGVWKIVFTLSWALIIAGLVMFVHRGGAGRWPRRSLRNRFQGR